MNKYFIYLCSFCFMVLLNCGKSGSSNRAESKSVIEGNDIKDEITKPKKVFHAWHRASAYLSDIEMNEQYQEFLYGTMEVINPFDEEAAISFYMEEMYAETNTFSREELVKYFALVDVNGDQEEELVFRMKAGTDELMIILSCANGELTVFDVYETHTSGIGFSIYDTGIVVWGQNHTGDEEIYYAYDKHGDAKELIHFISTEKWQEEMLYAADQYYESYYLDGKVSNTFPLNNKEAYDALISEYIGNEPDWYDMRDFKDVSVLR